MKAADLVDYVQRFWANVDRSDPAPDACWLWTGETNNQGYGRFDCWEDNRRTRVFAHRLVLVLSGAELDPKLKVLHRCDNPPCCNPAHLRVGTQRDNVHDALAKGRMNLAGLALGLPTRWGYR